MFEGLHWNSLSNTYVFAIINSHDLIYIVLAICSENCHRQHGYCTKPNECRCKVGWMGTNCTKCHPYPGCKNGICHRPWECICNPGWGGILCDEGTLL